MANPSVMLLGTEVATSGALGTSPLGTAPLGGNANPVYELPKTQAGSDRFDARDRRVYGEIVQERDGLVVGYLQRGSRRKWHLIWKAIDRDDSDALLEYADAKRFYLLPDGNPEGQKIVVLWLGAEIAAESLRAGYRNITADWIELTGPAATVV